MAFSYQHGVETIDITRGAKAVKQVRSAVIGLVGIAPTGATETLTLVTGENDAAQFGLEIPGYSIPQALKAIFAQGAGTVLVVNVLSVADNIDTETSETHTVTDLKITLTYAPYAPASAVVKNSAGTVTYVYGTDYTLDEWGVLNVLATITEAQVIKVTYTRLTPASVSTSQLVGDKVGDVRTGMRLFEMAFGTYGMKPKIIIAPGYSSQTAVRNAMLTTAEKHLGIALIDQAEGTTPTECITDRGVTGDLFKTSNKRAVLLYPALQAYDEATADDELRPYSQFLAGVIARTDRELGYWYSPSNKQISGITGVERSIEWNISDADTEATLLNEAGIMCVVSGFGTGYLTWGNRNASYPSVTTPDTFISVLRVMDVLADSVELSMLPFIDQPLNQGTIDSIKETVNAFIRTLIQRGALVDGECVYLPENNTAIDLAAGKVKFNINCLPPSPAEWIQFERFIDVSMYRAIQ